MFMTSGSFKGFRKLWLGQYRMLDGMLFQASEFDGVSKQWGIMFSIWQQGQQHWREWAVTLKRSTDDLEKLVETFGEKVFYNLDERMPAGEWFSSKQRRDTVFPNLRSGLSIADKSNKTVEGAIGSINNHANCQMQQHVIYLVSGVVAANGHKVVTVGNFSKCCALFTARRSIACDWINDKDEYSAPNEQHPDYEQWNDDAIVYSLFNSASNQSSLRNVEYKGKLWQIKNSWFWLPRERMIQLANEHGNDAVYQDARTDSDRFVHKALRDLTCSADARAVLDKATGILEETFAFRGMADDEHPEWQVNTWDAGWYQVKLLAKRYTPELLEEFRKLYKKFEGRMREGVYTLGFLRR